MDINYSHAIIKYFKSYIAVIISVDKTTFIKGFGFATIFHPQRIQLCASSSTDHPSAIIEYTPSVDLANKYLVICALYRVVRWRDDGGDSVWVYDYILSQLLTSYISAFIMASL